MKICQVRRKESATFPFNQTGSAMLTANCFGSKALACAGIALMLCTGCGRPPAGPGTSSDTRTTPTPVAQSSPTPSSICRTPAAREQAAFQYDSDRKTTVLFGGAGTQIYGDTWLLAGSCWQQAQT